MLSTGSPLWALTTPIFVAMACSSSAGTSDSAIGGGDAAAAGDTVATDDTVVAGDARSAPAYDASVASIDPPPCESLCSSVQPSYPTNEAWGGVGNVTTYSTSPSAGGACQYGTTQVRFFAAISVNLQPGDGQGAWQNGRICGQCAEVLAQTSQGPRTAVVRIMDKCPDGFCGIDLGGDATAAVMADYPGRYAGRWKWVPCTGHPETFDGPTSLYVKLGSSKWWSRIQIRNPPTGISSMAWRHAGGTDAYQELTFAEDNLENFYTVPTAVLQASSQVEILVRYTDGTSATLKIASDDLGKEDASYPLP
jgi:expansin (peptidoglycan-binding protein)